MNQTSVALALFGAGWLGLITTWLLEAILTHNWVFLALLLLGMTVAAVGAALMLRGHRSR